MTQQPLVKKIRTGFRTVLMSVILVLLGAPAVLAADYVQGEAPLKSRNILWKVQSPQNTIFLAGSLHVLQKEDYPLHPMFEKAFNVSSRVMFEVNLDDLTSPKTQMAMLRKGLFLNGETLPMILEAESYAAVKTHLSRLGHHIEDFHQMKPWMTATAVMALELQKLGFESANGVDRYFFEKAQVTGKAIQGLETVEFQLDLFDNLPPSVQEQFLLQTLEDLNNLGVQVREMVQAWKQGNVQELEALLMGMGEYPELNQVLILNRNRAWLPHLEQALQEKAPVFVVVGALHLLGKEGLVETLKENGYRVQQL